MIRKIVEGAAIGVGIVGVIALAIVIAWAGDVFTVDKDGTLKFAVNDQGKITVGATESYVNLVIQNNSAVANNKVDITADVLTVEGIRLENVNVSADITASGAGGLDTGSEAANTWYYVWVITNNTGTSMNGLLSASSTSPTMPSGFTKKRRVGTARNNASSDFLQFVQEGNKVSYLNGEGVTRVLSGGTSTIFTTISVAAYIPPTSRRGNFNLASAIVHSVAGQPFSVRIRQTGTLSLSAQLTAVNRSHVSGQNSSVNTVGDCTTDSSQQIDYLIYTTPDVSGGAYIDVFGYYDRM